MTRRWEEEGKEGREGDAKRKTKGGVMEKWNYMYMYNYVHLTTFLMDKKPKSEFSG